MYTDVTSMPLTLYQRHSDYCTADPCTCPYWIYGRTHGSRKVIRRSLKTGDYEAARRRLSRYESGEAELAVVTVESAIKDYMNECDLRHLAMSTLRSYICSLTPLATMFTKRPLHTLTTNDFVAFRASREVSAGSVRKELQHQRAFFQWCMDRGHLGINIAKSLKAPKPTRTPTLPFTHDEIARLSVVHGRHERPEYAKALVLTFLYSGLRISDLTKLKPEQITADGRLRSFTMQKTGEYIYVKLPLVALDALAAVERRPWYFWEPGCQHESAIEANRKVIKEIGLLAGVSNCHPHRFRDTFAVELLINGESMRTVQLLLGHKNQKTTEDHYAPFVPAMQNRLDEATAKLRFG